MGLVALCRSMAGGFWKAAAALAVLAAPAQALPAVDALAGRPPARQSETLRCTDDGRDCVRLDHYAADVCKLIERNATERGLDPNFLARLLWKESLRSTSRPGTLAT